MGHLKCLLTSFCHFLNNLIWENVVYTQQITITQQQEIEENLLKDLTNSHKYQVQVFKYHKYPVVTGILLGMVDGSTLQPESTRRR